MSDNDKVEAQEETPVSDETDGVEGGDASEESEQSSEEGEEGAEGSDKKKSNWKAMSKLVKALRKENAELKSGKSEDSSEETVSVDKSDLALFLVENPDAKEYKAAVLKAMKEYVGISLEKAWKFVKATSPKPSESKQDMSVKFTAVNPPKDLSKLPESEALKLPTSQYLKWGRATGRIKN